MVLHGCALPILQNECCRLFGTEKNGAFTRSDRTNVTALQQRFSPFQEAVRQLALTQRRVMRPVEKSARAQERHVHRLDDCVVVGTVRARYFLFGPVTSP